MRKIAGDIYTIEKEAKVSEEDNQLIVNPSPQVAKQGQRTYSVPLATKSKDLMSPMLSQQIDELSSIIKDSSDTLQPSLPVQKTERSSSFHTGAAELSPVLTEFKTAKNQTTDENIENSLQLIQEEIMVKPVNSSGSVKEPKQPVKHDHNSLNHSLKISRSASVDIVREDEE